MTEHLTDLDAAVDWLFARVDGPLRIGAPLALGKPHRLLNALYARVEHDPSRPLQLYTALSLNPPKARGNGLEARFMAPFTQRHFGDAVRLFVARQSDDTKDDPDADFAGLSRQQPGAMGIGSQHPAQSRPAGWSPPAKPDLMTANRSRGGKRAR